MEKTNYLGELLVQQELITQDQLDTALQLQQQQQCLLGDILVNNGFINEHTLLNSLAGKLNVPFVDLMQHPLNPDLAKCLPEAYARRYQAIILDEQADHFLVGMVYPTDLFAQDALTNVLPKPFEICLIQADACKHTLDVCYRRTDEITSLAHQLSADIRTHGYDLQQLASDERIDAPVYKLLQSVFEDAMQVGASDIHIQPEENCVLVRWRTDGRLHEHSVDKAEIGSALAQRLKLMANLNIAEKRLPQDGRFSLYIRGRDLDIRLSTMPTPYGEAITMRILDQYSGILQLEQLGMTPDVVERFRQLSRLPYGMVLVTGPTGSGKTTSLYASLKELNTPDVKIITVEDPIEYRLPRITQVQVKPTIDLTFARVLRSSLRHDPDIIMVGEIRDSETASIALRAAMTGHLVLSTLHTNDASSSVMRLMDMGVEGYSIASALRGVMTQRLVRRLCDSCKENYEPNEQEKAWLTRRFPDWKEHQFYYGKGCHHCHQTGYHGRIGVYELLAINQEMIRHLRAADPLAFAVELEKHEDHKPLINSAYELAQQGVTDIAEVLHLNVHIQAQE